MKLETNIYYKVVGDTYTDMFIYTHTEIVAPYVYICGVNPSEGPLNRVSYRVDANTFSKADLIEVAKWLVHDMPTQ